MNKLKPKLHICLLTSGRIFEIAYGGEERFTLSLADWLVSEGHDVTLMGSGFASVKAKRLLSPNDKNYEEMESKPKTKMRVINPSYHIYALSRWVLTFLWIGKIFQVNHKFPITILHVQDTGYAGLAAVIAGKILRIPVVISSHGIRHKIIESIIQGPFKKQLLKAEINLDYFTIKRADMIIVANPFMKTYFQRKISKDINVVPTPIKSKNFEFSEVNRRAIRDELGVDDKTIILGFVGRLSQEKNLFTLLTSFAKASESYPSIKMVFIGAGPLEEELKDYVNKTGISDKVIFCGVRYDVNKILSSFDIFVLPSYVEGLSTALLEAMTCERAIICSDIPANREFLRHNHDALLVDPYNSNELDKAIVQLCSDNALRLKLGSNAKINAYKYDQGKIFPEILRSYENSLQKNRQ